MMKVHLDMVVGWCNVARGERSRRAIQSPCDTIDPDKNESGAMAGPGAVHAAERVSEYFSDRASDYQARSTRFPWAWIRSRELTAVRSLLGDVAGLDVLELGAGAGFYARELARCGARQIWAVDISEAMLAALPAGRITPILGDAATMRLDRCFPVLLSTGMLEFVHDPSAVLANAAHHATPRAHFIILAPQANILGYLYRRFHRAHGIGIHLFDRSWFETIAPRSGWRVHAAARVLPFSLVIRLHRA
jgi:SAM-dependent methyltransferase